MSVVGFSIVLRPPGITNGRSSATSDVNKRRILINNAGMQHRGPLKNFEVDAIDRQMRTNVNSAFYVGQAVGRHMIARGAGRIINIASVQTALARPGIAPYTASKGAIANLNKGMTTDWVKHCLLHTSDAADDIPCV
mgnify:CR=1 FL=1